MTEQVAKKEDSWCRRMAQNHVDNFDGGAGVDTIELMLEAACELKAVRLKILLARCYEIICNLEQNTEYEVLLDSILEEIK